jgi:outer membrane receptor protein involved in Fe transport
VTLTSLTAYQRFRQNDQRDIDGVDVNDQYYIIHGKVDSVFQELRAGGDLGQGGRWIVGANYARDVTKERDDAPDTLQSGSYLTGGSPYSLLPFAPWLDYFVRNDVRARTLSAFGNLDLALTDRLMAHAGIRYTDSRQQMAGCTGTADANLLAFFRLLLRPGARAATPGGCTTILQNGDQGLTSEQLNETNVPFQLGLDYKIEPDKLVYASIRKGFKAGTTPAVVPTSYIQRTPVTQESLVAYEGGFKLSLMDRQLQLNGAGFIYDYTDKQLLGRIIDPTGVFGALQALVNIPKSRVHGAELTATVTPREVRGLTVDAAVTWLDSKVTSNFVNYASYVASAADTIDFKGEPYPYTPRWAVRGGVRYEWMATDNIRANVGASGSAQSRMNGAFGAQKASREGPSILIKPYGLLDLSAGIEAADRRWRVDLWGRNMTNTYYWNTAFYQSDTTVRYTGMPATYGVTASINFR